jgi:exportin-1
MSEIEAALQRLLSGDFDVDVLDHLVTAAYDPVSPHRAAANKALMQLQEAPDLWTKADAIIENSKIPQCRFFGLQVLDDAIKSRYVHDSIFYRDEIISVVLTIFCV